MLRKRDKWCGGVGERQTLAPEYFTYMSLSNGTRRGKGMRIVTSLSNKTQEIAHLSPNESGSMGWEYYMQVLLLIT